MALSRTRLSFLNANVAVLFYFIGVFLSFFSRKIFLDNLGAEVLGLNSTLANLLGFLNIAELGIVSAISYSLYKPLYNKEERVINEIVSVQGFLYRKIGYLILIGGIVLMFFFPLLFHKTDLPLWYSYITFFVLLTSSVLGYFFNYKQILLIADQKQFKITYNQQGLQILKTILQIVVVYKFNNSYIWWLIIELLFGILKTVALEYLVKKEYKWLAVDVKKGQSLMCKYDGIILKTKQLFIHKISAFILNQTSPLIIYAYASLTMVTVYGNYILLVSSIIALLNSMFNSLNSGIGNLVAEGNIKNIHKVFWELFSIRFLLTCSACYGFFYYSSPFINLWLGKEYELSSEFIMIIIATMYMNLMRAIIDSFIVAYGIYHDVWAPVLEAFLNLFFSLLLGYYWGLIGIILGPLISLFVIIFLWKPFFCCKYGLKMPYKSFVFNYAKHLISLGIVLSCMKILIFDFSIEILNYKQLVYSFILRMSIFSCCLYIVLYILSQSMRDFSSRFFKIFYLKFYPRKE